VLAEELDKFRTSLGRIVGGFQGEFSKFEFVLPLTVGDQFVTSLKTRIVEGTTVSWHFWYGLLLTYVEEYGHAKVPLRFKYENFNLGAWVSNKRRGKDNLDSEKIQQLESLPQWSWNVLEDQWYEVFDTLKKYVAEQGHASIPTQLKYEDFNLGRWASCQRQEKNKLSPEKCKLLESLPQWSWKVLEDQWYEVFDTLKKYVEEYGHAKVPLLSKYEGFNLGSWISTQRGRKDKLDLKRIQLLESLPQWSWDVFDDRWNEGFEYLKKYVAEQGHAIVSAQLKYDDFNLGRWVSCQRKEKNKLSPEKSKLLESLPQWSWNVFEEQWNEGFNCLKQFVEKYGHAKVPNRFRYEDFNLGTWVSWQRKDKNKLSPEKILLLEELPRWSWDALEDKWNEGFEYLKNYGDEYRHARVPHGLIYQNFNLGTWVSTQRQTKDKLDLERIKKLESLPQWSWRVKSE
jgi:hypothetical protein